MTYNEQGRRQRKRLNKEEALALMQKYCVYQDRCHSEVRTRLIEHQVYGDELEEIISSLIADNFLNEERFATAFATGKCKIKRWGRVKIRQELKRRQISEYCIKKALRSLDHETYYANLIKELSQSYDPTTSDFAGKVKVTKQLQRKGYTYAEVIDAMGDLQADHL